MDASINSTISRHDLISLDVFDTAIFRAIAHPTDVFALVKLRLMTTTEALHHPDTINAFPEMRIHAEEQARERKRAARNSSEVTFGEIYEEFARLSGADASLIDLLKRTELELEEALVYPNQSIHELISFARSAGKRVIFCSDMYLPAATVEKLLARCGFTDHDGVFVSCHKAVSKSDGTMFRHIASHFNVLPARIAHFGDNEHGDYKMAKAAGCTAVHLPHERLPDKVLMNIGHEKAFSGHAVGAIIRGLISKWIIEGGSKAADRWERIGYRIFGPLFTGFMLWLTDLITQTRPDRVLLLARDSWFVSRNLGRFLKNHKIDVPCDYVYVSRAALLLASMTDFPTHRLWHLYSGKSNRTVSDHLRRLGLAPGMHAAAVRSAGFESLDEVVKSNDPKMHKLLATLFPALLREGSARRPLVTEYLEQYVGDARKLALVDIGWCGNMQGSILRLLGAAHRSLEVKGYYLGLHKEAHDNDYPGHSMRGWITHYGQPDDCNRALLEGGVELLEFAMAAPHGTTLGYRRAADGRVEPVLEENTQDAEYCALAARVQKGAEQFLDDFMKYFGDFPAEVLIGRAWAADFYRLASEPTREEAELLGDLTHSDIAGSTQKRLPLAPAFTSRDRGLYGAELGRAYWKAGFRVRNRPNTPKARLNESDARA